MGRRMEFGSSQWATCIFWHIEPLLRNKRSNFIMNGTDAMKHGLSAKPADFTITRQIAVFGDYFQQQLLKLSVIQALLSHKLYGFNDNLHFQRFYTQRLLVDDAMYFCCCARV